jgi:hypothetical protein
MSSHVFVGEVMTMILALAWHEEIIMQRKRRAECASEGDTMSSLSGQVREFHAVMDCPTRETPTLIPEERVRLRAALIAEEFFETMEAMSDMGRRGRQVFQVHPERVARGAKNGNAALTVEQVRAIRATAGKQRDVAKMFGVSQATVWCIRQRKTWKEI